MEVIEKRQGLKIDCLEGTAYRNGWITEGKISVEKAILSEKDTGHVLLKDFVTQLTI